MNINKQVEKSIITTYRTRIYANVVAAINEYKMIQDGDKIAICLSGGKDSFLLAKCMQEIQKHHGINFEMKIISMDPGYNSVNRRLIEDNAKLLEMEVNFFDAPIFEYVTTLDKKPCYICARMRRGYLYKQALSLGCNKLALGHHFDDVIETNLLSMFYNGQFKTMMPKLLSTSHKGMEIIRPLYLVKEKDIIAWANHNELKFIRCACKLTQEETIDVSSKRNEMKELINEMRKTNPRVDKNIFNSGHNVNLKTIIGYFDEDEKVDFETYYNKLKKDN